MPYSPHLNPDKYLNAELKARLHASEPTKDLNHLKRKVLSHVRSLQRQPEKIRKYFQAPAIRYVLNMSSVTNNYCRSNRW